MSHHRHPIEAHSVTRRKLLWAAAVGAGAAPLVGRVASAAPAGRPGEVPEHRLPIRPVAGTPVGSPPEAGLDARPEIRSVGGTEVIALCDASGSFFTTRQVAFPTATAADWARAALVDPAAFGPDDRWNLDFRCYAIRRPGGRVVLVDVGVGPAGSPASSWAPVPGHLPERLAGAGIDPDDVDLVVLTHVHEDHVGWSVTPQGVPLFRNARYVVQRDEVAALEDTGDSMLGWLVEPLRRAGRLSEVDGATRLVGGVGRGRGATVRVLPTPGHTPGHQSVVVEHGHRQIVVTGDVLVHAVQLVAPEVAYRFERNPERARRSRQDLLGEAATRHALLATAHLRQPFVPAAVGPGPWT